MAFLLRALPNDVMLTSLQPAVIFAHKKIRFFDRCQLLNQASFNNLNALMSTRHKSLESTRSNGYIGTVCYHDIGSFATPLILLWWPFEMSKNVLVLNLQILTTRIDSFSCSIKFVCISSWLQNIQAPSLFGLTWNLTHYDPTRNEAI